jgi:hypothetical protein
VRYLTEHWTQEELCRSNKADELGVVNLPGHQAALCLERWAVMAGEPARSLLGRPMTPSSGFRNEVVNAAVGGEKDSQHLRGEAVDFVCDDMDEAFIHLAESDIPYDQIIREHKGGKNWVHLSYTDRREPRREALVIDENGTRTYVPRGVTS